VVLWNVVCQFQVIEINYYLLKEITTFAEHSKKPISIISTKRKFFLFMGLRMRNQVLIATQFLVRREKNSSSVSYSLLLFICNKI